jgi:hypothetical protein
MNLGKQCSSALPPGVLQLRFWFGIALALMFTACAGSGSNIYTPITAVPTAASAVQYAGDTNPCAPSGHSCTDASEPR